MKKPKLPKKIKKVLPSRKQVDPVSPVSTLPKITNETVAEHREEVLSTARKYIYPLQHSRHKIVVVSITIFVVVLLAFFSYTLLALYRFNDTSGFMYRVTSVLPLPIAKAGPRIVYYNSYLFEIRRYLHYYETQLNVDFSDKKNKEMLVEFRKRSLDNVIQNAYLKQLAKNNHVSVSRREIDGQINLLKAQNRLGSSDDVLEDTLREYWGWSFADFRKALKQEILTQKVAIKLDKDAQAIANSVLAQINSGGDFASLAKQYSQDLATKDNGGNFGITIERNNRDLEPEIVNQLFKLQVGQTSGIVETAKGLEIIKLIAKTDDKKVQAAHIFIGVKPANDYVEQMKKNDHAWRFIST